MRGPVRAALWVGAVVILAWILRAVWQPPAKRRSQPVPIEVSIPLPSGSTVTVRLRPLPPIYRFAGRDPRRLLDIYDSVEAAAKAGDATAQTFLHRLLERCRVADAFCEGLTDAQKETSAKWLQAAVDQGEFWSLQESAARLGNSPEGVVAWRALWKHGHFAALPALSVFYQRGVGGLPPDYLLSFAYNYLQLALLQAAYAHGAGSVRIEQVKAVEASLRHSETFLMPGQRAKAVELAEKLLRESGECCVGLG